MDELEEFGHSAPGLTQLRSSWSELDEDSRKASFFSLQRGDAEELFLSLASDEQWELIGELSASDRRSWVRLLPLDDTADLFQVAPVDSRSELLGLLDELTRREVMGLLAYAEDDAGGLMNPRYLRIRPEMTVDEAIRYIRAQARTHLESIYYAYVLDQEQCLLGTVNFRELLLASPEKKIEEMMTVDVVAVPEAMDREEVSRLFSQNDLLAIPVVDQDGRMKGIVTYDDIVTVVEKEATEDMQKLGGMEALEAPYLRVSFWEMIRKRGGWLTVLFIGEMFTATAMSYYEHEISKAVILALFVPLIISSGGNSGSQASTLMIRALALREVRLRDWPKVMFREIGSGLALGLCLGLLGFLRILLWQYWTGMYGEHYLALAFTVAISLVGVVIWGTLSGSMLPFVLQKLRFDPASASAPFVATLVDVSGLVIYFTVASLLLSGSLL